MPGDPNIQRTLDALTTLVEGPGGWPDEAIQKVAAEAKHVIESLDELGPDSAIEQGISRLELLRALRGEHPETNLRYRGHRLTVDVSPLDGLVLVRLLYVDYDGKTVGVHLMGEGGDHARAIRVLRELDITIDAALALHPLREEDTQQAMLDHFLKVGQAGPSAYELSIERDRLYVTEAMIRAISRTIKAEAIDQALNAAKQVADATAHLPAENVAVWDVIERLQKLRPVGAPTEQDRAEAEAEDEREGKAAARAEEVQTDGE